MMLPPVFLERTAETFEKRGIPSEGFAGSFDAPFKRGIRLNRSKVSPGEYPKVLSELGIEGEKVPWCASGFYSDIDVSGNDPYYLAGVYYPQEPSAMLPAEILAAKPGDRVLDLCAAPGGKAVRIGEDLKGEGVLFANEINENRAKALLRNIERMGISNAVILNEDPKSLAKAFPSYFDKILIDAPCSGEGMFRRDPNAIKSWEKFGPSTCTPIQKEILDRADAMLRRGGEIVYSTCTFCEDENELMIEQFMKDHPWYEIIPHPEIEGVWHNADGSMRILPHLSEGDGHFCVHMRKSENAESDDYRPEKIPSYKMKRNDNYGFGKSRDAMMSALKAILTPEAFDVRKSCFTDGFILHKENIHIMPVPDRMLKGLKVVKMGLFPGEIKLTSTERLFIPSHSLVLTFRDDEIREDRKIDLGRDDERLQRYLKGETLSITEDEMSCLSGKGYVVIEASGYPVGWGKVSTGQGIKNLYPKSWRLL